MALDGGDSGSHCRDEKVLDVRGDFGLPPERAWLNTAHQGALPRVAADAAHEAVAWKLQPNRMTTERFGEVPGRLKRALGRVIDVPADDIILSNGASYGLHLLANGLPLADGEEILLMEGDFPSNLMPFRALMDRGVRVRLLRPADVVLMPQEIESALTPRTRLVCVSWVHSFSGRVLDIGAIGDLCRKNGTWFAVNASQALGVRSFRAAEWPVDALLVAGWKWLCGPYATGFAWMRKPLLAELGYNQAYWQAAQNEKSLREASPTFDVPAADQARRYDVFGTANFFNFLPLAASVEYLLELGVSRIEAHVNGLVERLLQGLSAGPFELVSRADEPSSLVLFKHRDPSRHPYLHAALADAGIDVALRMGSLRISPHLYNSDSDIDRALEVLRAAGYAGPNSAKGTR